MKKSHYKAVTVFLFITLMFTAFLALNKLNILEQGEQQQAPGETRLVNLKFAVQDALSYGSISGAKIYIWTSEYQGDPIEVLTTDATGTVTSQAVYETGSYIYVFVTASGYYPTAQTLKIPSTGLASEQTLVPLPAVKLYKISTTVSLAGSTIGAYALTSGGSGSLTTAFQMDIKIGSIDADSVYGAGQYIDYSSPQRYQYVGPIIIVRVNDSIVAPDTPTYTGDFVQVGGYYYYVFLAERVINDADDPFDGQTILSLQWKVLQNGAVSIDVYILDSVRVDNLGIPQNLLGYADASIVGFVATVTA